MVVSVMWLIFWCCFISVIILFFVRWVENVWLLMVWNMLIMVVFLYVVDVF